MKAYDESVFFTEALPSQMQYIQSNYLRFFFFFFFIKEGAMGRGWDKERGMLLMNLKLKWGHYYGAHVQVYIQLSSILIP